MPSWPSRRRSAIKAKGINIKPHRRWFRALAHPPPPHPPVDAHPSAPAPVSVIPVSPPVPQPPSPPTSPPQPPHPAPASPYETVPAQAKAPSQSCSVPVGANSSWVRPMPSKAGMLKLRPLKVSPNSPLTSPLNTPAKLDSISLDALGTNSFAVTFATSESVPRLMSSRRRTKRAFVAP